MKKKISLVKFNKNFITKNYLNWLNDKELMKFSHQRYYKHTKKSSLQYLRNIQKEGHLFYASLDYKKKIHVGNVSAHIDKINKIAEIRMLIGHPGNGYGHATFQEMIRILKKKIHIRKITSSCASNNHAVIKIFKKSILKYEFRLKKHGYFKNNIYTDVIGYSYIKNTKR